MPARRPDRARVAHGGPPSGGSGDAAAGARASAIEAIVARHAELTAADRLRLGRWTSASLRDPRLSPALEGARDRAIAALDAQGDRRRRWDRATRPLHEDLVAGTRRARTWRIAMLGAHLVAVVAIAAVPGGFPPVAALLAVLLAPLSTWLSWGRGLGPLGAIHAALAAATSDRLGAEELAALRRSWQNAVEIEPPTRPPLLGALGALLPSAFLLVVLAVVVATSVR